MIDVRVKPVPNEMLIFDMPPGTIFKRSGVYWIKIEPICEKGASCLRLSCSRNFRPFSQGYWGNGDHRTDKAEVVGALDAWEVDLDT